MGAYIHVFCVAKVMGHPYCLCRGGVSRDSRQRRKTVGQGAASLPYLTDNSDLAHGCISVRPGPLKSVPFRSFSVSTTDGTSVATNVRKIIHLINFLSMSWFFSEYLVRHFTSCFNWIYKIIRVKLWYWCHKGVESFSLHVVLVPTDATSTVESRREN